MYIYLIYTYYSKITETNLFFVGSDLEKGKEKIYKHLFPTDRQKRILEALDFEDGDALVTDYTEGEVQILISRVEDNHLVQ